MRNVQKQSTPKGAIVGKQYNYQEVIEFLDTNWQAQPTPETIKQLDQALGSISQQLNTVLITGTNGKSLTIHFLTKLLNEEKLSVGSLSTPHILTYNERISLNNESIANKNFTDLANEVLAAAHTHNINVSSADVLTMMGLLHFKQSNVDIVLLEATPGLEADPVAICNAKIVAITRLTDQEIAPWASSVEDAINKIARNIKPGTHVVSADQSKLNLQVMQNVIEKNNGIWGMPIRKLAQLTYPFEQLHGRCAALAERIAQIYINTCMQKESIIVNTSLLVKQSGQRGRPTLKAKKDREENPRRTIEQFWKETTTTLPGRFQLLDKEKPTILLDTATNLDAFENLLLGIRLHHYQRSLKGLVIILGCNDRQLYTVEFLKLIRYFFKKTSGSLIICPTRAELPNQTALSLADIEKFNNELKNMKIKAKVCKDFNESFESATKSVDERNGLVVITGSNAIVSDYWHHKGLKKL